MNRRGESGNKKKTHLNVDHVRRTRPCVHFTDIFHPAIIVVGRTIRVVGRGDRSSARLLGDVGFAYAERRETLTTVPVLYNKIY